MISIYEITVIVAVFIIEIIVNYCTLHETIAVMHISKISFWLSYKELEGINEERLEFITTLPKKELCLHHYWDEMFATNRGIGFATITHHYL